MVQFPQPGALATVGAMRKLLILLALAIPGCGGALPPKAPMDAAAISSPFNDGTPVMTGALAARRRCSFAPAEHRADYRG